jgi:hypothetical protein
MVSSCDLKFARAWEFDRAGDLNDFFRFSTTDLKWEQLDAAARGLGYNRPSGRYDHGMVSVGSDLYVFGGYNSRGEEGLCDDGHRLGACQIERLGDAPRAAAVRAATSSSGVPFRADGDFAHHRYPGTVGPSGGASKHIHIERQMVHRGSLQRMVSACDLRFARVWACLTVQVDT